MNIYIYIYIYIYYYPIAAVASVRVRVGVKRVARVSPGGSSQPLDFWPGLVVDLDQGPFHWTTTHLETLRPVSC